MIFFDIDGTLLSHRNYQISESTKRAIQAARKNGHLCFVNTGRTIAELEQMIIDVGFDGYVCGCGTYISYNNTELFHYTINPDLIQRMINDFRKYKLEVLLEGYNAVYFDTNVTNPHLLKIRDEQYGNKGIKIKTFDDPDISFDKFCIMLNENSDLTSFHEIYKEHFHFIHRARTFYEVVPIGFSKSSGIRFLEEHLNIPHDNTFALGDSINDLDMLEYVKHSIAMGNGKDAIKKIASYITEDVDQDGVEKALKHYGIINEV